MPLRQKTAMLLRNFFAVIPYYFAILTAISKKHFILRSVRDKMNIVDNDYHVHYITQKEAC